MPTPRKPTPPTAEAIDQFCAAFDALFARREERQAFRHYLIGLLLPREHNKTVVELAALATYAQIAEDLNAAGWRTAFGRPFTSQHVGYICCRDGCGRKGPRSLPQNAGTHSDGRNAR